MAYRLLALDMDGTLLRSDKTISAATWQAICDLAARGVEVALCTGRNPVEVSYAMPKGLGPIRYGSLESGALACDFADGATLACTPVPADLALRLIEIGSAEDAMVHLHCVHGSVVRGNDISRMDEIGMGIYQQLFETVCTVVDDLPAYVRAHPQEVCKVNLYHKSSDSRARTIERISNLPLELALAEETSLECSAQGVSKATGIAVLCERLGFSLADVVAVGDAGNDEQVLKAAGCAVAMGNATNEVKAIADLVVADCDHDGIVEAINRLF